MPDPVPDTAQRAVQIAEGGGLAWSNRITVRSVTGGKFPRIVGYELGPVPELVEVHHNQFDPDEVPF